MVIYSDVVETETFETETWLKFRDETETDTSSKTPRPRLVTWNSRPRPRLETRENLCILPNLKKMLSSLRTWIFFKFLSFFQRVLFLTCKYNKQKSLNYRNFNKPFLCNIHNFETWSLRDRDSQKWVSRRVSRPRPSPKTPSLVICSKHTTLWDGTSKFKSLNIEKIFQKLQSWKLQKKVASGVHTFPSLSQADHGGDVELQFNIQFWLWRTPGPSFFNCVLCSVQPYLIRWL